MNSGHTYISNGLTGTFSVWNFGGTVVTHEDGTRTLEGGSIVTFSTVQAEAAAVAEARRNGTVAVEFGSDTPASW